MTDPTLASEAEGCFADLIDMVFNGEPLPADLPRCATPNQEHDPEVKGDPDDCPWCIISEVRSRLCTASRESER